MRLILALSLFLSTLTLTAGGVVASILEADGSHPPQQMEIIGKVVGVSDGDTITVLKNGPNKSNVKIRLLGIDCPEKSQDFGYTAKRYLSSLIFGKTVKVIYKGKDCYRRIVGKVYLDGTDINLEMLKAGLAWHYKRYDHTPEYAKAELQAKEKRIGLWQKSNPIPPWNFRRKNYKK